ncbi:MAG: hypothetical protein H7249_13770 [Chitinophagaceae bacterium]|nr:hypothetical protein [Oligoflexus sp.]
MSSTKEIYWVCREPSADVQQKVGLLEKYHITVRILPDFATLLRSYSESRLNTIILGDDDDEEALELPMMKLSNHPEYSGVRFILSLSKPRPVLVKKAVDLGFRDIIPVDLPDSQWLRRYAFASSGRPTELLPSHPQMSMQGIASVQIPGRIAWITAKELWLETRLLPPVGSELSLSGGLADIVGLKQIRLKVLNRYRSHLHFRYSEALLCSWDVPVAYKMRKNAVQEFIEKEGSFAHYRFYAIIRNREIRNSLVKKLPSDRFQLTVALNKNNMIQEPRFISPDAIIIEDKMCQGANQANFDEMLKHLDHQIPVFVMGEAARSVQTETPHRLIPVVTPPEDYPQFFETHLGTPKAVNLDATQIPKNNALSFATINLPARILNLHPDSIELASAFPLGRFGLFGIDAPIFQQSVGQRVHGKVLDTWEGDHQAVLKDFPFHARALLVDLTRDARTQVAHALVELFKNQMLPKLKEAPAPVAEAIVEDEVRAAPVDIVGAGPMRTEISRPLRDLVEGPAPILTALDTEIRPLEEQIGIDRNYQESGIAGLFEALWDGILIIPKEVKITVLVALGLGIAIAMALAQKDPVGNQGAIFTEQLKKYEQMHNGSRRSDSPASEDATP